MNMTERNNDKISIHALLAESDLGDRGVLQHNQYFYPRSPCGERRNIGVTTSQQMIDFYPRSPCGERRVEWRNKPQISAISIHALLAESDGGIKGYYTKGLQISIHALLAESDATAQVLWPPVKLFLSTLSLRRATFRVAVPEHVIVISIHALLAESDSKSAQNSGVLLRI